MASSRMFQLPLQYYTSPSLWGSSGRRNSRFFSPNPVGFNRKIGLCGGGDDRSGRRGTNKRYVSLMVQVEKGDATETRVPVPLTVEQQEKERKEREKDEDEEEGEGEVDPDDLEYVSEIKRALELLRKNRDMLFSEVKLTIMIEDPREVERKRLLGIEDADGPTREDLAEALVQVNEEKVPKNRLALRMLYEEMINWPNLEIEATKTTRGKSLYAKATDTGVDPKEAAKRLNMDWDSAAEIEDANVNDSEEVPAALGYGALYLVSAFPIIIGISVVLILFYNSLQ
ncbi:PREDICTED: ycf3-interacting protein 1, chloroplastic [Tarenaya hassleriana]|uniref:ycf3-interacting protein 1, chloroplastic n=1 Tax=Tarenaya hassleriana TaxID=28532 RepID=UPI00053C728E|nr:PREDICTED: ycf3-interacting protein 1, chloroplastic [Tarenaya hassleriana]